MGEELNHEEIARNLAKAMADKANKNELRRLYEETMFQQFISMEKSELSEPVSYTHLTLPTKA